MEGYMGLGEMVFEHGDYQRAIQSLDKVIAKNPKDVNALLNRGIAKDRSGNRPGAISDYTAVIELEGAPKEAVARALVNRGYAKRLSDDVREAISAYTAVIELEGAPKEQV